MCAVLVAVGGQRSSAVGETAPPGTPLTKAEYFDQSIRFMEKESKTNGLFFKLALNPLPRRTCAAEARRYHAKLLRILNEATSIVPPPEIAHIHARLIALGGQVVRRIGRSARRARAGKVVCGENLEHPTKNEIARRIYRIYDRSGFDPTLQQLRDLGYAPSGE